jgi:serine phosphatase RsbU (regulator of sigma subunit)
MSTPPNPAQSARHEAERRLRSFWTRLTEGFELEQLWGQFVSEAKASYGLYSKDVDWEAIHREQKKWKRPLLGAWALFQALLMKLSPARRVLLLIAVVLLVFQPQMGWNHAEINLGGLGALILFLLLALELADRVTMKRDLEIAREIQKMLVPSRPPFVPQIDIAFTTRPQNTVAGDYYDAFLRPLPDVAGTPSLIVVVADVAGKSVPAALLMATFQASLRALAATPASLREIVVGLERYARAHSLEGLRFTTAFLAEVNPETHEMQYVNAGHNDPILRRASGQMERLCLGGPPFGVPLFREDQNLYPVGHVALRPGDLLIIFTDGVVEALGETGEEFGEARLLASVQSAAPGSAADTLDRIMTEVNTFVGYVRQHDDITCLVVRVGS